MTRTSEEIARGLESIRDPRPILPGERIHVLGAAGSAAAASLLLAMAAGARVSGCDAGEPTHYSEAAEASGIPIVWRHDPAHLVSEDGRPIDRIAVSKALTAIDPDQPELRAAREAGIPASSCQQLIADAIETRGGELLAVAGTHGKSTTTGWLVHLLVGAGFDPSAFVGAVLPAELTGDLPSVVRLGRGGVTVVEADEYAGNFDPYRPSLGILLNADWDHPDVFASRTDVIATFEAWIRRFRPASTTQLTPPAPPMLIANAQDPGVAKLLERLVDWPGRLLVTAVIDGDAAAAETQRTTLTQRWCTALGPAAALVGRYGIGPTGAARLTIHGLALRDGETVQLQLLGRHNADDGLAAAAAALAHGAAPAAVLAGLATFGGVGRRFELIGEVGGVTVLDDYGHHPTAIGATLDAVALRYPGRRVWAVYEPLTFHRTAAMLEDFALVLARADRVAIADIFAVRDPDTTIVCAADLARAVERHHVPAIAPGSVEATADALVTRVEPGDVVLVMGGGRSSVIATRLVATLNAR